MNLYHYCSNAAFVSIISTREIWLSEFSLSNDVMEGKWIRSVFQQMCSERKVPSLTLPRLMNHLDIVLKFVGGCGLCMSEKGDLLSQWRAYATDGAGVAIGFEREYLDSLGKLKQERNDEFNLSIQKVEYNLETQKNLVAEHLDGILDLVAQGALNLPTLLTPETPEQEAKRRAQLGQLGMRFLLLFPFIHEMKNPAFAEEREWRAVSHILASATDGAQGQFAKMDFRPMGDRIIPYRRIPLEESSTPAIQEIVLGPRNLTPEPLVEAALLRHGWPSVSVRRSTASYRR